MSNHDKDHDDLSRRIAGIEARLERIESRLGRRDIDSMHSGTASPPEGPEQLNGLRTGAGGGSVLESRIGEYGLAWMGNIVLLFGFIFLTQYIRSSTSELAASLAGFASAAAVLAVSYRMHGSFRYLSQLLRMNGILLLFYYAVRLHYFSAGPLLTGPALDLALLAVISVTVYYLSFRLNSGVYAGLAIVLAVATGIISNSTHIWLPLLTLCSIAAMVHFFRFGRWGLLAFTLFLVYLSFLTWILGNPFISHKMEIIPEHHYGFFYLFATGVVFTLVPFVKEKTVLPSNYIGSMIVLNGIGFSFILLMFILGFFSDRYTGLFAFLMVYCLAYAIILRLYARWEFAPAFYAVFGFVAMSIVFYGLYGFPRVYWLLGIQSLIVVSMALWFRNRFIVLMNSLMFVLLVVFYLAGKDHIDSVNFTFALVALLTARILNWKKKRLAIRTEFLRNLYLLAGFFLVLYALYRAVPGQYVTLSWTIAALFYFGVSLVLKNVKYRYMALSTMILAAFNLFLVDLARIGIAYRIVAFLFLAVISIGISVFYSGKVRRSGDEKEQ